MANFIKRILYMVASTQPPAVLPNQIDNSTVSGVGFFKGRFQFQQSTAPVGQPEVPFWQFSWSEPVKQRISGGLAIALTASGLVAPVFTPTPETVTVDKWNYAWSEPVRQKAGLETRLQQPLVQTIFVAPAETITADKWLYPWSEPVRQRAGLAPRLQQSTAQTHFVAPAETINADKWIYPWSEPVRFRRLSVTQQPAQEQHVPLVPETAITTSAIWPQVTFTKYLIYQSIARPAFTPAEVASVDKWTYPWSEPVRQKIGLRADLQQSFIGLTLNPDTQITQNYESRWHYAWSEPVRIRPQVPAGEQQTLIQGPPQTPEFITVDKWIYGWSEPVRQKIGLKTHLQQALIAPVLNPETQIIQTYESRWHYPWSEPVRFKQIHVSLQPTYFAPTTYIPPLNPEFTGFASTLSSPVTFTKWIIYEAEFKPVPSPEQLIQNIESRWHQPWSEPVRFRRFPTAEQQAAIAPATSVFETVTVDKWIYPWSEPVRQKIGLKTNLQQAFIGLTLEPNTQIIQTYESRWHQPWSEPVRRKPSVANQPTFTWSSFTPAAEVVTFDKWLYPLNEPVRVKRGLFVGLQQSFTTTTVVLPAIIETSAVAGQPIFKTRFSYQSFAAPAFTPPTETITYDKWGYAWSEPVRFRIDKQRAIALAAPAAIGPVLNPNTQITQFFESRWHFAWSEPKRFKLGFGAWLQQATILQTPPEPTLLKTIPWFDPLNEPVRLKIGLMAALQRFFQTSQEQILADVTLVLSATEVNGDSAFFGVTSYNQVAPVIVPATQTVVSIKEIEAVRVADTSIEEQPAYDSADVSMKEQ